MASLVRQSVYLLMALVLGLTPLALAVAAGGGHGVADHLSSSPVAHHATPMAMDDVLDMAGDCQHCSDQCCEQGVCTGISCGACVAGILPCVTGTAVRVSILLAGVDRPVSIPVRPSFLYRPPRA